ncbi:hypothetical protein HT594_00115 [Phenacoccus solenopsis nudivirus]|nr:hypothetical protein HT594_00115 [Phenacoccus solenopsis nudivirus]
MMPRKSEYSGISRKRKQYKRISTHRDNNDDEDKDCDIGQSRKIPKTKQYQPTFSSTRKKIDSSIATTTTATNITNTMKTTTNTTTTITTTTTGLIQDNSNSGSISWSLSSSSSTINKNDGNINANSLKSANTTTTTTTFNTTPTMTATIATDTTDNDDVLKLQQHQQQQEKHENHHLITYMLIRINPQNVRMLNKRLLQIVNRLMRNKVEESFIVMHFEESFISHYRKYY